MTVELELLCCVLMYKYRSYVIFSFQSISVDSDSSIATLKFIHSESSNEYVQKELGVSFFEKNF